MSTQTELLIEQVKDALPEQAGPVIDAGVKVLQAWADGGQLGAWVDLMSSNPDAGELQLLNAMSDEALAAAMLETSIAFDQEAAAAKALALQKAAFWKSAVNALLTVAGAILVPLL